MRRPLTLLLALVLVIPLVLAAAPGELDSKESGAPTGPTHYVQVSDGTWIALHVQMPDDYVEGETYPTVFEMSGYESGSADGRTPAGDVADATGISEIPLQGGTRAAHGFMHDDDYVTVMASLRGTGCSSGEFDLFSWRSALDGREVIDGWIAHQPWSNGDVAIYGHSYSGITGTMIAATRPAHLRAASVSGLIGDIYRDIVYPGGITNYGFPLLWTGAVRPLYDVGGGVGGGLIPTPQQDCAAHQAEKSRTVLEDPLIHGLDDTDSEWYRSRSLIHVVGQIEVPFHITTAYQDEQTGPRGGTNVWHYLPDDISKRLVMTNGDHGTQDDINIRGDGLAWLDYWMQNENRPDALAAASLGERTNLVKVFGPRKRPTTTTRVILGYRDGDHRDAGMWDGQIDSTAFPLPETQWTDLYASAGGALVDELATVEAGSAPWLHGSRRQAYSYQAGQSNGGEFSASDGPDEVVLSHTFDEDTVVAGPITATLQVSSTAPETELFVQLIDRAPSGEMLYLQRGMLRGGHRAYDRDPHGDPKATGESLFTENGRVWRPWRAHSGVEPVIPGETVEYLVEIFPVGHVFPAGHELVVKIHAPPMDDNDYLYVAKTAPSVNTLHFSQERPSSLMLPVIPIDEVEGLTLLDATCEYEEMRCVTAAN
ncbi:MAG: CocE/NonD family hydrolase [Nitriliruptorales bacterium]|nr:CocE/NonD family hydrolase [Nitriliruptorales bacterium]